MKVMTLLMQNKKFQEVFWYLVFGVLTTVVNLIVFGVLDKMIDVKWMVKIFKWDFDLVDLVINIIAWVAAVVFAFFTNRTIVFHSKGNVFREFWSFMAARLFTFFAFELGLFSLSIMVMENAMHMPKEDVFLTIFGIDLTNKFLVKLFVAVFVVIFNYVFSKLFIFKKPKEEPKKEDPSEEKTEEA